MKLKEIIGGLEEMAERHYFEGTERRKLLDNAIVALKAQLALIEGSQAVIKLLDVLAKGQADETE